MSFGVTPRWLGKSSSKMSDQAREEELKRLREMFKDRALPWVVSTTEVDGVPAVLTAPDNEHQHRDLVARCPNKEDAELIVAAVNVMAVALKETA